MLLFLCLKCCLKLFVRKKIYIRIYVGQPFPLSYFVSINAYNYPHVFFYYFAFTMLSRSLRCAKKKTCSLGSVLFVAAYLNGLARLFTNDNYNFVYNQDNYIEGQRNNIMKRKTF